VTVLQLQTHDTETISLLYVVVLSSCACIYGSLELSSRYRLIVIYNLFTGLRGRSSCYCKEFFWGMSHTIDLPSEP